MPALPIPTWSFAIVVVRLGHRFLVVREQKHGQLWYLPAGRVEPGESFVQAGERETLEESGVPVVIESFLRIEHTPRSDGARMRVFFVARPRDDTPPKSRPDQHTLEARWVTLAELDTLPLRGSEVKEVLRYVAGGGAVFPLSAWTDEGARWSVGER